MKNKSIFLSYHHSDLGLARAFRDFLRQISADKIEVSWDREFGQHAGQWRQKILDSIDSADHVLVLVTPASARSRWIAFEAGAAFLKLTAAHVDGDTTKDLGPTQDLEGVDIRDAKGLEELGRRLLSKVGMEPSDLLFGVCERFFEEIDSRRRRHHWLYDKWDPDLIGREFQRVRPKEEIGILQTWIPDSENATIHTWAAKLGEALARFGPGEAIDLEVMLMGSATLAEQRAHNRPDLSRNGAQRSKVARQRVERSWRDFETFAVKTGYPEKVRLNLKFYTEVLPSGPVFRFGGRVLFAGYYPILMTSDQAPMLEVRSDSTLWKVFLEQFGRLWGLPSNRRRPDWCRRRVVLAPDSFKECLSASEVCQALQEGIENHRPDSVEVVAIPTADGGEGSLDVIRKNCDGRMVHLSVSHPLGKRLKRHRAGYFLSADHRLAVIESAKACGLELIPAEQRDPHITTTRGVGELVEHALRRNARHIIVTVGGSATVDAGTGLARALGFRFLDAGGKDLEEGGLALQRLARIENPPDFHRSAWRSIRIEVACDVDNPLLGENGASRVYAEQKGRPGEVDVGGLEHGLARWAEVVKDQFGRDFGNEPHAGAAGGLAAGLACFVGAELRPGFDLIRSRISLSEKLRSADLVVTGEGRTDAQTLRRKVCQGVSELALDLGTPCILVSGAIAEGFDAGTRLGVVAAKSLMKEGESPAESMAAAEERLRASGLTIVRELERSQRSR